MSDIFISYAKEDRERAKAIAAALEEMGWSVWWDRMIPTGTVFDDVIQEALDSAKSVIVLWSSTSVESRWVKAEAERAVDQEKLFPALIERVPIPMAFSRFQTADLVDWDGDVAEGERPQLFEELGRVLGVGPQQAEETEGQNRAEPPLETESASSSETPEPPKGMAENSESRPTCMSGSRTTHLRSMASAECMKVRPKIQRMRSTRNRSTSSPR